MLSKIFSVQRSLVILNGHKTRYPYAGFLKTVGSRTDKTRRQTKTPLHRFITDAPEGLVVDHINHNTLDNRMKNLRVVTATENKQNINGAQANNKTSNIRGVSFRKDRKSWIVLVGSGNGRYVGSFKNLKDAEYAAKVARAKRLSGSYEALLRQRGAPLEQGRS